VRLGVFVRVNLDAGVPVGLEAVPHAGKINEEINKTQAHEKMFFFMLDSFGRFLCRQTEESI